MTLFLFIAASALAAAPALPTHRYVGPAEAITAVKACGVGSVTYREEAEIEDEILIVSAAPETSDAQLACVIEAANSYYTVELPASLQVRYDALADARARKHIESEARAWLAANGLLERVPPYEPGRTPDVQYAAAVEALCGPAAKGALSSSYGPHALSPDWFLKSSYQGDQGGREPPEMIALHCMLAVTQLSGFDLGFIGNEAVAP